MKNPGDREGGKRRVRDLVYRRQRSHGRPVVRPLPPASAESAFCGRCGAVYRRKTWRRSARRAAPALLGQAPQTICPACVQVQEGRYLGRVLLGGALVDRDSEAIQRRIVNMAVRAGFTQPERRVMTVRPHAQGLEVVTTSEKLAHRIARELEKAFGGQSTYVWSRREPILLAVWKSDVGGQ